MIHKLTIKHEYFMAILNGKKSFELREQRPDRYFGIGDVLRLVDETTGEVLHVFVTYVLNDYLMGLQLNWCCMSIRISAQGQGVKQ